jgi:Uma2 family endonuclease
MATRAQISPEEYLSMSFDGPDREYVNGEILERNVGEEQHSDVQWRLSGIIYELAKTQRVFGRPELRMRLGPTRFRIPDFAIFLERPTEHVPSSPPLVAVEIVSPDDRYSALMEKLAEYRDWGVRHIWAIDPKLGKLYTFDESGPHEVTTLTLPEFGLDIRPSDLF